MRKLLTVNFLIRLQATDGSHLFFNFLKNERPPTRGSLNLFFFFFFLKLNGFKHFKTINCDTWFLMMKSVFVERLEHKI